MQAGGESSVSRGHGQQTAQVELRDHKHDRGPDIVQGACFMTRLITAKLAEFLRPC